LRTKRDRVCVAIPLRSISAKILSRMVNAAAKTKQQPTGSRGGLS